MPLRLNDKKAIVAEVAQVANETLSAVVADYRGLTVSEMNELRARARSEGVYLRVVRNTLAKRAFEGTQYECLVEALTGPVMLALSQEDPGSAARLLKEFSKEHTALEVKALSIEGKMLPAEQIDALAELPNREQALAMLLSVMKAPVTKMVRTLAEPHAQLVRAVAAVKDQKEQAA